MWKDLSMKERAALMKIALNNGITSLEEIRNKYDEGGKLSDKEYLEVINKVVEINNPIWNKYREEEGVPSLSKEEELQRVLSDSTYDYRGYYNKYPNSRANAYTHWTDEFKTVYHPTFSTESIYHNNRNKKYNPLGLPGGLWAENLEYFIPRAWQLVESNKYDNGGIKDSWKPWYWFTPRYNNHTLKEALFKAYDDGLEGRNIIHNGNAYKVSLSENDIKDYYSSNPTKIPRFTRIVSNDSKTANASTDFENNTNIKQKQLYKIAKNKGYNSDDYYIPYIYNKEIKIPNIGRVSTNILDSLAVNAERAGIPVIDALGLATEETVLGATPNYSLQANKEYYKEKHGTEMPKEVQDSLERRALNASLARNFGGIHPQFLVNDHEWYQRGWEESPKYSNLKKIKSPLEHAFTLFKMGLYNSGDTEHSKKIRSKGNQVFNTPIVQNWYKEYKSSKK